jgi:predicted GIY-YIG superfamily endonuclease
VNVTGAWVYMLRCADGSLYTGWCVDPERRLSAHRSGRASKYTASRLPVEIVFKRALEDRAAARREEARIKSLSRREKLELIADQGREHAGESPCGGVSAAVAPR